METSSGLSTDLTAYGSAAELAYGWRSGGLGYLILAQGMEAKRFSLIARSVHRAARKHAPIGPRMRTALAKSRAESQPCLS